MGTRFTGLVFHVNHSTRAPRNRPGPYFTDLDGPWLRHWCYSILPDILFPLVLNISTKTEDEVHLLLACAAYSTDEYLINVKLRHERVEQILPVFNFY